MMEKTEMDKRRITAKTTNKHILERTKWVKIGKKLVESNEKEKYVDGAKKWEKFSTKEFHIEVKEVSISFA